MKNIEQSHRTSDPDGHRSSSRVQGAVAVGSRGQLADGGELGSHYRWAGGRGMRGVKILLMSYHYVV